MSEALAKISLEVEGPRGPDVSCDIVVPADWLAAGRRIQVALPERLVCASCSGGGCDTCGRSGALAVPKADTPLELTLPTSGAWPGAVRVRLPGWGAEGAAPGEPRGHLMLFVRAGDEPSRGVFAISPELIKKTTADPAFVLRILLMVVLVSLLFVFLLRFSGWM